MSKKDRPRFHVRSDRRVYDGAVYMCTADSEVKALRIRAALCLAAEPAPKTLPPSPSSVDGLPEIPDGLTRVTVDCLEGTEIRQAGVYSDDTWLGQPVRRRMQEVTTINGPVILRRMVQRGKRA